MYCDKCGFNNLDDAKFCEKCGNDLSSASNNNYSDNNYSGSASVGGSAASVAAMASANGKKIIAAIVAVLVVIGAWMLLSNTVCSNMSKESPVKYFISGNNSADAGKVLKAYPAEVKKALKKDKDGYKDFKNQLKAAKITRDGKIKYKITDKDRIEDDDKLEQIETTVNEVLKAMADRADIKHKDLEVKDAYEITVKETLDGDSYDVTYTVYKAGGKWYLLEGMSSIAYYIS